MRKQFYFTLLFCFATFLLSAQNEETEEVNESNNEIPRGILQDEVSNSTDEDKMFYDTIVKQNNIASTENHHKNTKKQEKNKVKKEKNSTIQPLQNDTQANPAKEEPKSKGAGWVLIKWIGIILGTIILLFIISDRYSKKCRSCGKWNAMVRYHTKIVGRRRTVITEIRKTRNGEGKVIRTQEVDVPATVTDYEVHRRCKYCGHKDVITETETKKN
ncbi:hypothetical protein RCZ04_13560 [Capnocytophaga sp. HP1101]